jgi:hypothetical protein
VCGLLCLVPFPKCAHFASLTLPTQYWGSGRRTPLHKPITITWIVLH